MYSNKFKTQISMNLEQLLQKLCQNRYYTLIKANNIKLFLKIFTTDL